MRSLLHCKLIVVLLCCSLSATTACAAGVAKTNSTKVYMHYMPWFETPATLGGSNWGYHWKMQNKNPNVVDSQGQRQIAAHYYPKIGPYASRAVDVIEYHMLLMKMAGVDGVMIDWYGVQGTNGDLNQLLTSSNAIVGQTQRFGLTYSVVLEDRFSANIGQAKANVAYLRDNYFNDPNYIRINATNDPLLMVFGPITFDNPAEWTEILAQAGEPVNFLTLWYESHEVGSNAAGEYAWIWEDGALDNYQSHITNFYASRARQLSSVGGIAFPGFDDFYEAGGVGDNIPFDIPHDDGQTLANTLNLAHQYANRFDFLQLATWNDFGEGTMFEPTVETGYDYLLQLQNFTGVDYGLDELELVFQLFRARKAFTGDALMQGLLDQASALLTDLEIENARAVIDSVLTPGDFNADGTVDGRDFLVWQRQVGQTGYYPLQQLAADTNADGVVDAADLALWQQYYGYTSPLGAPLDALTVPEPGTLLPLVLAASVIVLMRQNAACRTTLPATRAS